MSKETILSFVRTLLIAIGGYLVARGILTDSMLQNVIGVALAVVTTIWSILDKTAGIEMIQSGIRSVVTFVGGFLLMRGKVTQETIDQVLAFLLPLASFIYSYFSRKKTQEIIEGKLDVKTELKT